MRTHRRVRNNLIRSDRGAAAVEFALLIVILIMLISGIVQFGIIFNYYVSITHAAREGARWAALEKPVDEVITKTIDAATDLNPKLTADNIEVDPVTRTIENQGEPATVTITYTVPIRMPFLESLGTDVNLVAEATQRIE